MVFGYAVLGSALLGLAVWVVAATLAESQRESARNKERAALSLPTEGAGQTRSDRARRVIETGERFLALEAERSRMEVEDLRLAGGIAAGGLAGLGLALLAYLRRWLVVPLVGSVALAVLGLHVLLVLLRSTGSRGPNLALSGATIAAGGFGLWASFEILRARSAEGKNA